MKPISVTMQAFGPYLEKTTVDFTKLGDNPIFLITGATGGGKTTILDAMSFALYCRATGGRRSWSSMRCAAAPKGAGRDHGRFCLPVSGHDVSFYALAVPIHRAWNWRAQDKGDARLLPDGGRRMGAPAFRCGVSRPGEGGGNLGPHLRAVFPGHCVAAGGFFKAAPVQFAR